MYKFYAGLEVFTAAKSNIPLIRGVTLCRWMCGTRRFDEELHFHIE